MGTSRSNNFFKILALLAFIFVMGAVCASIHDLMKKVDSLTSKVDQLVQEKDNGTSAISIPDRATIPGDSAEEKFNAWGYTLDDAIRVDEMVVGGLYCVVDADLGPTINMTMAAPVMWAIDSPYYDPTLSAPEEEIIPIVPIGGLTYLPVDLIGAGDNPPLDYVRTFDGPCAGGKIS